MVAGRARGEGGYGPYKGGWRVRMTVHGQTYERTFRTRREAIDALHELQASRKLGVPLSHTPSAMLLGDWLEQWLASVRISRPRTAPTYGHWVRHLRPLGHLPLRELSASVLIRFFTETLSPRLAPESRRHVYQVLHVALNVAVRRRFLYVNPLDGVPKPRGAEMERPTLTLDECRRLLDACAEDRLGAMVVLGLYSGAREGELLALEWRDIDLEQGTVSITKSLTDIKGQGLVAGPVKTRFGRRVISVGKPALEALAIHRQGQAGERLAAESWPTDLIFTTTRGTPMRRQNFLQRYWYPLLSRANLPRIHFHDLRHTAALLMMRGGHIPAVSRRLGHSTTTITTELYGHAHDTDDDRITDRMNAILSPPEPPRREPCAAP